MTAREFFQDVTHVNICGVATLVGVEKGAVVMGQSCFSRDVIRIIKADGWYLTGVVGDHHQFKHPVKKGRVTVPHPKKDLKKYELASIKRQSGLDF